MVTVNCLSGKANGLYTITLTYVDELSDRWQTARDPLAHVRIWIVNEMVAFVIGARLTNHVKDSCGNLSRIHGSIDKFLIS